MVPSILISNMGGGEKTNMSRRTKRQLARIVVILGLAVVVLCYRRADLFPGIFGGGDDGDDAVSGGGASSSSSKNGGDDRGVGRGATRGATDDPATCAARTTRHVNQRMRERLGYPAPVPIGSSARDAAKISFTGPLVLNARMKRPPKVPKSNGEMEDLGALTAEQRRLLPERDILDTLHYGSCAVVGNGGLLLMYEHGHIIDSHDAVIRFNDATTKPPYTKHAGSKTTIRLVNSQHRGYTESPDELILQHLTAPAHLKLYLENRRKGGAENRDYALTGSFYAFVRSKLQKMTPTNGMYGLYLAGALCDRVTIFGFLRTWYNDTRYHYHNPYEPTGTQGSRDSAEMPLIESLVNKNPEIYSFGEPCVGPGAHLRECPSCPPGSVCVKGTWHPVPDAGRCYRDAEDCLEPAGCAGCKGETPEKCVPSPGDYGCFQPKRCYRQNVVNCFPPCEDPASCPGGKYGMCPS